jgi:hypothetical protein
MSSTPSPPDHNALFGVLAVQTGFITRDQLAQAMNAREREPQRPLGELLIERGVLRWEEHDLLQSLVNQQLDTVSKVTVQNSPAHFPIPEQMCTSTCTRPQSRTHSAGGRIPLPSTYARRHGHWCRPPAELCAVSET